MEVEEGDDVVGTFDLQIYLSYSPCENCSSQLINFLDISLQQLNGQVRIWIGAFYYHEVPTHWNGLVELASNRRVELSLLNGNARWESFLNVLGLDEATITEYREIARSNERQEREREDRRINRRLKREMRKRYESSGQMFELNEQMIQLLRGN